MRTYEQDFVGWSEDTAKAIEEGRWHDIDRAALADEVLSLGKSDKRQLRSAIRMLMLHLLKVKCQPQRETPSWIASINEQRNVISDVLEDSPSLCPQIAELMTKAYRTARIDAAIETGLGEKAFPKVCPWNFEEVMGQQ